MSNETVYLTTSSGRTVHFSNGGTNVYAGNSGETLYVTENAGDPIRVTNPEKLSGKLREMWERKR